MNRGYPASRAHHHHHDHHHRPPRPPHEAALTPPQSLYRACGKGERDPFRGYEEMSDSVDRVFSHALNTVNKIRTGSEKPPAATRLKLYGLYKQAMEGDVEGILTRPAGGDDASKRSREKYDAWSAQRGLSRTEAKRRYITTLIETMHKYAAPTPDVRELVSELEFVWDQIKSNTASSSSGSSPVQTMGGGGGSGQLNDGYVGLDDTGQVVTGGGGREGRSRGRAGDAPMRVLSPASADRDAEDGEEFVDAMDGSQGPFGGGTSTSPEQLPPRINARGDELVPYRRKGGDKLSPGSRDSGDSRWRRRVEGALIKLTAEVAALREQLESRRLFSRGKRYSWLTWAGWAFWGAVKFLGLNALILGAILLYMRRKKDRRLEGAVRVLLGEASVEVQRVGKEGMKAIGKIQLPGRKAAKRGHR